MSAASYAQAAAEARVRTVRARIAADAERLDGVSATVDGERIVLTGRGIARRSIEEPGLRWIAEAGR